LPVWGGSSMFYNALSALVKFIIGAVLIGAVLNAFDITADQLLHDVGFTPQGMLAFLRDGLNWALPHFVLGAMVLVPIWLIIYLLKPPRMGK